MIKLKHSEYWILLAIGISVLSLTWSIVSFIKNDDVGRYQSFVVDDSGFMYVLDTRTSRLFLRGPFEGNTVCLDLGTVDRPLARLRSNGLESIPGAFPIRD